MSNIQGTEDILKSIQRAELLNISNDTEARIERSERSMRFAKDTLSIGPFTDQRPSSAPSLRPGLQAPSSGPFGGGLSDPDQTSIIAIIGTVMALQAKSNSSYWSTVWQQSAMSMQIAVEMAPIIKQAVIDNYDNQASATQTEANMTKKDGIIGVTASAAALFGGVIGAYQGAAEDGAADTGLTDTTKAAESASTDATQNLENSLPEAEKKLSGQATRALKALGGGFKTTAKGLFRALEKTATALQAANPVTQATTNLFVNGPAKVQMANYQRAAGAADALSKVAEQYNQYYNQEYNRMDSLRQGTQQNIDTAMNILKSAADGITQVTISMFRG